MYNGIDLTSESLPCTYFSVLALNNICNDHMATEGKEIIHLTAFDVDPIRSLPGENQPSDYQNSFIEIFVERGVYDNRNYDTFPDLLYKIVSKNKGSVLVLVQISGHISQFPSTGIYYASYCVSEMNPCSTFHLSVATENPSVTDSSYPNRNHPYYKKVDYMIAIDGVVHRNSAEYFSCDDISNIPSTIGICNHLERCLSTKFSLFEFWITPKQSTERLDAYIVDQGQIKSLYDIIIASRWRNGDVINGIEYYYTVCLPNDGIVKYYFIINIDKIGLLSEDEGTLDDYFRVKYEGKDKGKGEICQDDNATAIIISDCAYPQRAIALQGDKIQLSSGAIAGIVLAGRFVCFLLSFVLVKSVMLRKDNDTTVATANDANVNPLASTIGHTVSAGIAIPIDDMNNTKVYHGTSNGTSNSSNNDSQVDETNTGSMNSGGNNYDNSNGENQDDKRNHQFGDDSC